MNGLVRAHVPHLRDAHLPFFGLQRAVTVAVAWCIVPVCIAYFGVAYLLKHDGLGTAYHLVLFLVQRGYFSCRFTRMPSQPFGGSAAGRFLWSEWRTDTRFRNAFRVGLGAVCSVGVYFLRAVFFTSCQPGGYRI